MTDFKSMMAKAKEDASKGGSSKELEPGSYTCILKQAFVNKSKAGKLQGNFDYEVVEGDYKGTSHRVFRNLEHEVGRSILVSDLEKFGYDAGVCESEHDLDDMLKSCALSHPAAVLTIYTKNGYTNTKVVEFLGYVKTDEETEAEPAPAPTKPEKTKPIKQEIPEVPEEEEAVDIVVGLTVFYEKDGKTLKGTIKAINVENETVDFPLVKGVPVNAIKGVAN
jgi:hypothetical protein